MVLAQPDCIKRQRAPEFRDALEQAHATGGWRGAWQKAADLSRPYHGRRQDRGAYWLAEYYLRLGDKDQALDWLLKAADERFYLSSPKWTRDLMASAPTRASPTSCAASAFRHKLAPAKRCGSVTAEERGT